MCNRIFGVIVWIKENWKKSRCCRRRKYICFGYIVFEVFLRYLSRVVKYLIRYVGMEFRREVWVVGLA